MTDDITLPPLPEPRLEQHELELWGQNVLVDLFDGQQMRAYVLLDRQRRAAPSVPAGWRLVPVEPTEEIRDAVCRAKNATQRGPYALMGNAELDGIYRAAIAAAPPPPNAEPVAWYFIDEGRVECSRVRRVGWLPLYAAPPAPSAEPTDHTAAMRMALDALLRGRGQILGVLVQEDQDAAIDALRKALEEK
jgi:hypothetical protein